MPALAVGLAALAAALPGCHSPASRPAAVLCHVNAERRAYGRRPLVRDPRLERAARSHARDMVRRSYFEHVSPGGSTLRLRVARTGWMFGRNGWWLGEDLAWGSGRFSTPARIVQAWMNSPHHKKVMLSPLARVAGIGVADGLPHAASLPGTTYDLDLGS